jgi:hypothetical protein
MDWKLSGGGGYIIDPDGTVVTSFVLWQKLRSFEMQIEDKDARITDLEALIHLTYNQVENIRTNMPENALAYTDMRLGQVAESLHAAVGEG